MVRIHDNIKPVPDSARVQQTAQCSKYLRIRVDYCQYWKKNNDAFYITIDLNL